MGVGVSSNLLSLLRSTQSHRKQQLQLSNLQQGMLGMRIHESSSISKDTDPSEPLKVMQTPDL